MEYGFLSIVPALLAVVLAFITRDAIFSLLIACVTGVFILGKGVFGLSEIFMEALGTADFMWVCQIEVFIGVLVAFFFF